MNKINIKRFKDIFESVNSEYISSIIKKTGVENPIINHNDLDDLSKYFTDSLSSINLPFNKKYEIFGVDFDVC